MGHGWLPARAGAAQGNEMDALMGCTESERQLDLGSWNTPGHFVFKAGSSSSLEPAGKPHGSTRPQEFR